MVDDPAHDKRTMARALIEAAIAAALSVGAFASTIVVAGAGIMAATHVALQLGSTEAYNHAILIAFGVAAVGVVVGTLIVPPLLLHWSRSLWSLQTVQRAFVLGPCTLLGAAAGFATPMLLAGTLEQNSSEQLIAFISGAILGPVLALVAPFVVLCLWSGVQGGVAQQADAADEVRISCR